MAKKSKALALQPEPGEPLAENNALNPKTRMRYSDEEIYTVIVAYQLYGNNIYRTAKRFGYPWRTVQTWIKDWEAGNISVAVQRGTKERRGNLASKIESLVHDAIEMAAEKVGSASFSQLMVGAGIGLDKLQIIRRIEDDPAIELFRLIGLRPEQLPLKLELLPGEQIPEGLGPILETIQNPTDNSFEVPPTDSPDPSALEPHHPDCSASDPLFPSDCDCGADERNAQRAQDDHDQSIN